MANSLRLRIQQLILFVTFDQPVQAATSPNSLTDDFVFTGHTISYTEAFSGKTAILTVVSNTNAVVGDTVKMAGSNVDVVNSWNVASADTTGKTLTGTDTTYPTLTSAVYNDNGTPGIA